MDWILSCMVLWEGFDPIILPAILRSKSFAGLFFHHFFTKFEWVLAPIGEWAWPG
jgi:hypothetical protein